jgi:hypothetical protein
MSTYLIVDAIRLHDLRRMDAVAHTPAEAKALAEAMAKQYGITVTVLAPVGVVEGAVEPRWEKAIPGADVAPFGCGGGAP